MQVMVEKECRTCLHQECPDWVTPCSECNIYHEELPENQWQPKEGYEL